MPRNGSGTYSPPSSPGAFNPAITGQNATPTAWNTLLADLSAAMTQSVASDGQTTITADISLNNHKLTGVADGTDAGDATNLAQVQALIAAIGAPTGAVWDTLASSAPTGWVLAFGTIGDASSNATNRANADTEDLFTLIWSLNATLFPIYTSAGVLSTRGADAATDWAAHKAIAVADLRGRTRAGRDNMGGSAAGRLTSTTMTPDGNTLGATGGSQTNTASVTGTTSGTLSVTASGTTGDPSGGTNATGGGSTVAEDPHTHPVTVTGTTSGSLTISGTSAAFGIVQPTMLFNVIVKL